jgi:prepilin-type N-terminal cleavage/methylation domain-containing protein
VRRHFTLLELLCVIVILAILFSLLLPAMSRARELAYKAACGSNTRQIGIGMMSFARNNKGNLPWASPNKGYGSNGLLATGDGGEAVWTQTNGWRAHGLLRDLVDPRVFYCAGHTGFTYAKEWMNTDHPWIASSYTWNGLIDHKPGVAWGRNAKITDPGRTPMLADIFFNTSNVKSGPAHRDGFLVLRLDGSANFVKTPAVSLFGKINGAVPQFSWDQMFTYGWNGVFK